MGMTDLVALVYQAIRDARDDQGSERDSALSIQQWDVFQEELRRRKDSDVAKLKREQRQEEGRIKVKWAHQGQSSSPQMAQVIRSMKHDYELRIQDLEQEYLAAVRLIDLEKEKCNVGSPV